ncbi:TetR/AcrR family transcriptional regulator [Streptomyces sp. UNOB3_S3]|uniref:TetR/AcrR family transcriptional regulator n=1 Tax=Streptomyces sp. UNOB3_S3 TaxID=2871682 RepID=UPI001E5F0175|nr:TetR/AcrR family transcriptional regulator [Streptomyces sp. UNOB3_S3]MCC3777979.1 TetR/AcrR family transcriptional regulator [Streptomyces sp. UNOB3_S3]
MASEGRAGGSRVSVWLAAKPRRKTEGESTLDLERIVATTVRMLDTEGLAKFSMRRLAAELGVTAMSIYWYVDTKDDLLELALDQVSAEFVLPDPADETVDWHEQLRDLAVQYRRILVAHPWVSRLLGQYLNMGPHALALSEATLAVMRRSGVPPHAMTGAISALFQFVYGFASVEGMYAERCRAQGLTEDEYYQHVVETFTSRVEFTDRYQEATELVETRTAEHGSVREMWERDFSVALDTVIAGIEVMRDRSRGATRS